MEKKIVVHTGAGPDDSCLEERKALDKAADIELIKRGRCRTPEEVLEAVRDAHVGLCYSEPYTREVLANAPHLKGVVRYGVGVDTIDLEAATEYGVVVAHFPNFCTREVANHAIMHLLACAKKLRQLDHLLRTEGWEAARAIRSPMGTIHGETLGLLAFGNIAQATAERARALEMNIIAYDPFVEDAVFEEANVEPVGLEELASRSDYVSCHIPLNPDTEDMIDASFFEQMKPTAYFVNTSRGGVVKEADLIKVLEEGRIAGAGLDVFASEPIGSDHPFLEMDNVVLTPHTASSADETYAQRDRDVGVAAVALARGKLPQHVANPDVLDHRRT